MPEEDEEQASTKESSASQQDWTKGSILRNILMLAWPVMLSQSLNMAGPTVDMIWVGRLGSTSIAGVGVAGMAVQLVQAAMMGMATGLRALIARFWGAGDIESANHAAGQGFVVSGVVGLVMAVIGLSMAEQIMGLFGLEADVIAQGAAYMRIMFIGNAAMSFYVMAIGIMQASGDTITPMRITVFLRIFHIALAPFLIFGWWLFPRLGVSGAAITNLISQAAGLVVAMWVLYTGRTRIKLSLKGFRVDLNIIWRMMKIGIPASLTSIQWQGGHVVLVGIIGRFGTIAVAAHTLTQRAEQLVYMPAGGFGMAAGVMAGQNLGAGKPDRAERSGWIAIALVQGIMILAAAATFLWSENIVRIFNSEPDLVSIGSDFLKIAIAGYFVMGVCMVVFNSLNHVGDTMPPLVIFVIAVWAVELPMAYFLPQFTDLGVYAVRWSIVSALGLAAIAYMVYWKRGRWKRKVV